MEIICVNDGSVDDTKMLIERLASTDNRIQLINQKNSGTFVARKNGIKNATGNFIMFVDADDELIQKSAVSSLINLFLTNSDVEIIQFGFRRYINRRVGLIKRFTLGKISINDIKTKYFYDYIGNSSAEAISCVLWNKIYKADLVRRATDYPDMRMRMGEDLFVLLRILFDKQFTNMLNISSVYYKYNRYLGGSLRFDYKILNEYSFLKEYQNHICDTYELGFDAKFHCNLESVYYLMAVIYSMVENKMPKDKVLTAISESDEYNCIKYAKSYFNSLKDSNRIWEELSFLCSEYTAENYYKYIIEHPRKQSAAKKRIAFLKKVMLRNT